ncbi:hypothetical protein HNY73_022592 [Argiope bruennichi]|uniref:Uncharacterized protein n=1 Tax=Argiope bruennichi TaxID=94029 RepID=A0A8T0E2E7_ARGBR|nr:hypothetical protein HNY73_022592 [Argiope bruennichi]
MILSKNILFWSEKCECWLKNGEANACEEGSFLEALSRISAPLLELNSNEGYNAETNMTALPETVCHSRPPNEGIYSLLSYMDFE